MAISRYVIDDLAETTNEIVSLVVPQRHVGYHLYQAGVTEEMQSPVRAGDFEPLWSSVGGRVIADYLPEDRVSKLSEAKTAVGTSDPCDIELDSMGDRRIAFGVRKQEQNWQTIATPILTLEDDPVGAIEIIGLEDELSGRASEVEIPGLMLNAVKAIEKELIDRQL